MYRTVLIGVFALGAAHLSSAQEVHLGDACTLYVVDGVARPGPALDPAVLASARRAASASQTVMTVGTGATFIVEYNGFTEEAQAAFQAAVDIWADHIASEVPIRVEATFGPLGANVLGSAGPRLTGNFNGAPKRFTWYPFALADALVGYDVFPRDGDEANADIVATFSSNQPAFYFGTDGNPPVDDPATGNVNEGKFDFLTLVLHELGHGLGFVGSGAYDNGIVSDDDRQECDGVEGHGCWGIDAVDRSGNVVDTYPVVYDRLVEDGEGRAMTALLTYPQNSMALGDLLTSNGLTDDLTGKNLFLDGPTVQTVKGARAVLQGDDTSGSGSIFSHWDEFVYPSSSSNSLMTPFVDRGEAYSDPGSLTCALFQDIGWTLTSNCTALFPIAAEAGPGAGAPTLVPLGPNPFRDATAFRLDGAAAVDVSVGLVDALGRQVRTLYEGPVGAAPTIAVDGTGLAPGVYTVRVRGAGAPVSARVVRAR